MSERKAEVLMASVIIARSTSFMFNKIGLETMPAFTMLAVRFLLAFALLLALFGKKVARGLDRRTVMWGALVGFIFFAVMSCEMLSLRTVNSGTVSLLENLAIILVPLLEALVRRRLPKAMSILCALTAVCGVALLSLEGGSFHLGAGECIAILSAFLYAVGIITIDRTSHRADSFTLGVLEVGFLGLFALMASFIFETPRLPQTGSEWGIIAALAVVCTGFGYTLQPVAQSRISASRASLFCALSPTFATIFGAVFLRERVAPLGYVGIALIVGSILLPHWPVHHKKEVVRTVLFDMDGTLLNTLDDLQNAVNHILRIHGYPTRTLEEIRSFLGSGAAALMRRALPETVGEEEFTALLEEYRAWYQAHNCEMTCPYEGIEELLQGLKKAGVRVGIVSNKPDETTKLLARRFFPGVPAFGQRADLPPKPAPDLVNRALEEMGCSREGAVYVGDSEVDVQTGRNAGLPVFSVCWGFRSRECLVENGAEAIAATARELSKMLGLQD